MKPIPTLLAVTALCASAQADLLIVLHGSVANVSSPPPAGIHFQGVQVGDSARLAFTVQTPGVVSNQKSRYEVDVQRMDLEIGNGQIQSSIFASTPLFVGNDIPTPNLPARDYVTGNLGIPSVGNLDIRIQDNLGQMLNTADLSQMLGSVVTPGLSYMWAG